MSERRGYTIAFNVRGGVGRVIVWAENSAQALEIARRQRHWGTCHRVLSRDQLPDLPFHRGRPSRSERNEQP